jgi:hypothetical protein
MVSLRVNADISIGTFVRRGTHIVAAGTLIAHSERGSIENALLGGNPCHVAIQALCAYVSDRRRVTIVHDVSIDTTTRGARVLCRS